MTSSADIPTLNHLEFVAYINDRGLLPDQFQGKVGVYAIFDENQILQYIGYSRDVYLSLKQHLVRQPEACYWVKVQTIDRPSRTLLEEIRDGWMRENGATPSGNGSHETSWSQPINVKTCLTDAEQSNFDSAIDDLARMKVLKQASRRVEARILDTLKNRGLQEEIRFNPKMKEEGLLDLK